MKATADYGTLYPALVEAYDKTVTFADHVDLEEISVAEHDRLVRRALDAKTSLRRINESFVEEGLEKSVGYWTELCSDDRLGLANVEDVQAHLNGLISAGQIRVNFGDEAPTEIEYSDLELTG